MCAGLLSKKSLLKKDGLSTIYVPITRLLHPCNSSTKKRLNMHTLQAHTHTQKQTHTDILKPAKKHKRARYISHAFRHAPKDAVATGFVAEGWQSSLDVSQNRSKTTGCHVQQ